MGITKETLNHWDNDVLVVVMSYFGLQHVDLHMVEPQISLIRLLVSVLGFL